MENVFLPLHPEEIGQRGWKTVDIVLVTGDAYVDHPAFAMAVIGRVLEAAGFRVAIVSQPDWRSKTDFMKFGRPNLFFGISSGNMDSMVNKYTALRKVRNDDAYSEGGMPFNRPDRATIVYAQRAREAYGDVPIIIGGIEASLRRFAHYDYWSDKVRRSILLDAKADLLVYGMGERQIKQIAERLQTGESVNTVRDIAGTLFCMKEKDSLQDKDFVFLPSSEEVTAEKDKFNEATRIIHEETNPFNARPLAQYHGKRLVVQLAPPFPLAENEVDAIYDLPYTRKPHPSYRGKIPAFESIKNSMTIMRGCFGGCSFCSISLHQGRIVQSRSERSVVKELKRIIDNEQFSGTVTDIGGPTANMYKMGCRDNKSLSRCRKLSCIYPTICKNLNTSHDPLLNLMKKLRKVPGLRHLFVASGIRMDLALLHPEYIRELANHHVSGHLKVAPEHTSAEVLKIMRKPPKEVYEKFSHLFNTYSKNAGKIQFIIPYLIASHPGACIEHELDVALFLKKKGLRPHQIQDFLPSPMDIATSIYHTGKDPFSGKSVYSVKGEREKRIHRAIIQYYKKENQTKLRQILKRLTTKKYDELLLPPR